MDPDVSNLGDLVAQHKWVGVAAIVIYLLTRLVKSDTKFPITITPTARVWMVLGLGIASGIIEKVSQGKAWVPAIIDGLVSSGMAIVFHETMVASLRAGKEIPIPGLMIPGASPSPGAPVTVPPPADVPTPVVKEDDKTEDAFKKALESIKDVKDDAETPIVITPTKKP